MNQTLPSGPAAMPSPGGSGVGNSVITPDGVIRPIKPAAGSVNHRLPSGPAAIPEVWGKRRRSAGIGNSVMTPAVVIRPIWWAPYSVNHRSPSGPAAIPAGLLRAVGSGELGDDSARSDAADLVTPQFREPQVAVRAGRNTIGTNICLGEDAGNCALRNWKLRNDSACCDLSDQADAARTHFREPKVAVGAGRDSPG